jgi:hypothetical protein
MGNIKMDVREIVWGHGLDEYDSGECPVTDSCENGNEPSGFMKYWKVLE